MTYDVADGAVGPSLANRDELKNVPEKDTRGGSEIR